MGETSWSEDIKCFEAFQGVITKHGKQSSIPSILSVAKVDCLIRQRTSTCEMEKLSHPCRPAQTVGGKRGQEELDKTRHSKSPRVSWPGRNTSELLDQTTNWIQTRKTRSMRLYYVIINHCFLSILSCKQLQLNIPSPYISLIIYITKMWQFIGFQKTKSIYIGTALKYILTRQLPDGCFGCQKQISWPINETPSWFKPVCDHFSASATHMGLRCGPHIFLAYRPTTQDCGKWADVWQNIYGYQLA